MGHHRELPNALPGAAQRGDLEGGQSGASGSREPPPPALPPPPPDLDDDMDDVDERLSQPPPPPDGGGGGVVSLLGPENLNALAADLFDDVEHDNLTGRSDLLPWRPAAAPLGHG